MTDLMSHSYLSNVNAHSACNSNQYRGRFRGGRGVRSGPTLSYMNNDVMHTAIYTTKVVYRSTVHYTAPVKLV